MGLLYAIAYGVARGEDPYESNDQVGRRALDAARMVGTRWQTTPDPQEVASR